MESKAKLESRLILCAGEVYYSGSSVVDWVAK